MGCCCAKSTSRVSSVKVNSREIYDKRRLPASQGPVEDRSCTDTVFLIIFLAYVIFLLIAVGISSVNGDPRRLIYGVDSFGNICGKENTKIEGNEKSGQDMSTKKYLLSGLDTCASGNCKDCVEKCPDGYKQSTFRRCVSNTVSSATSTIKSHILPWLDEVGSDISLCWSHILLLCGISIGLSVVLMLVFRYFASFLIWAVLIIVAIGVIALTIFLWVKWDSEKKEVNNMPSDLPGKDLEEKRVQYWLIAAIVSTIFTVIYLLIVIIMRKRIGLVAALFEEGGKAIGAMPFILLQPLWTFVAIGILCAFLLVGFVCLQSSGDPESDSNFEVTYKINTFFQVARWLLLFGFLWMTQFVLACQHLVVSGAVSFWYFTRDKRNLTSPIIRSLCNTVKYHLGSASLGSFVIALVQLIRILFKMLEKQVGSDGQKCQILWKMLQCCLACFESYLKFLSRNAYIMIAISGESFCTSARKAFALLAANFMRLAALESIGDFVLFVGKAGVTVAIAFIGMELVKDVEGLSYIWVPVGIGCVFAFLICHCFLSVYEMAIDTLLLDFCDDCEKNDGVSRPYYMSRSLMMFVEKANKSNLKYRERGKGSI